MGRQVSIEEALEVIIDWEYGGLIGQSKESIKEAWLLVLQKRFLFDEDGRAWDVETPKRAWKKQLTG